MTTSENENDHFDLDHFDRVICKKRVNVFCPFQVFHKKFCKYLEG